MTPAVLFIIKGFDIYSISITQEILFEKEQQFFLDRTNSANVDFQKDFAIVQGMPVKSLPKGENEVRLLIDNSSIEVFINKG
jgi:fructan beta-fructosidase